MLVPHPGINESWTRKEAKQVQDGLRPLHDAERLDAVLLQFPWSFKNEEASLEWLGDVVAEFEAFPLVVEVRHASWNEPSFHAWLAEAGVGLVNLDQPLFHRSIRPDARYTAGPGYIRVHGRNYKDWFRKDAGAGRDARYDYLYPPEELAPWAGRARSLAKDAADEHVDVVFNNHYKAKAVVNALQFQALLENRLVPAPAELVEAYPEALLPFTSVADAAA